MLHDFHLAWIAAIRDVLNNGVLPADYYAMAEQVAGHLGAYQNIPSLCVYILIEQEMPGLVAYRRTDQGFVRKVYEGLDAIAPLPEIEAELPLAEVFDGVDFIPEPDDEEFR